MRRHAGRASRLDVDADEIRQAAEQGLPRFGIDHLETATQAKPPVISGNPGGNENALARVAGNQILKFMAADHHAAIEALVGCEVETERL